MSAVFKSALSLGKHCPPENISFWRTLSLREHCLDEKDAVFWSGLPLDDTFFRRMFSFGADCLKRKMPLGEFRLSENIILTGQCPFENTAFRKGLA